MKTIIVMITQVVIDAIRQGKRVEGRLLMQEVSMGKLEIVFLPYNRKPKKGSGDTLVKRLRSGWVKLSPKRLKVFASSSNELSPQEAVKDLKDQIVKGLDDVLNDGHVCRLV